MPNRHLFTTRRPPNLHGDNLEDEIKAATGLEVVDVTYRPDDTLQISIAKDKPAAELAALEEAIRPVVAAHKGITAEQVRDSTARVTARKRIRALANRVAAGETLTPEELNEAVGHLLVHFADTPRRSGRR